MPDLRAPDPPPNPAGVPPDAPTIGNGRYALVAKIAEGGMAGVYRAWDHKLRVWRAVKVLLPEYASRGSLRQRFEAEAHTMARLDHPNVIRVYDVGTSEALPYMVMELAEGGTLVAWVDAWGRMPPRMATDVLMQVARGLGAAHVEGVVHRDVKPHNVLITLDGRCKVTDFGIARITDGGGMTRTGSTMGTIGYMAPEQRSDAKLVDARADVYSLGAVLYKLLTGGIVSDLFLVEHEPSLLAPVAEPLREVILRCCFHDRDRRYADTAALVRALTEIRSLLPEDPPDTPRLATPHEELSLDRTPRDVPFPEIAELLAPRPGAPRRGDLPSAPPPAAPLPYTMSRPAPRRTPDPDEPTHPPWVDRSSLPSQGGFPHESGMEPATESTGEVTFHVVETPAPPPEVEATGSPMLTRALAVAALLAWIGLAALAAFGTWDVRRHATVARAARQELYEAISQEQGLIPELARRGVPSARTQPLYDRYLAFEAAKSEPLRSQAAAAYVQAVHAESDPLIRGSSGDLIAVRVGNLDEALSVWLAARDAWAWSVWAPHGRIATSMGLAPRS